MSPTPLHSGLTKAEFASKVAALHDEGAVTEFWNSVFNDWFHSTTHEWSIKKDEHNADAQRVNLLISHNKFDSGGVSVSSQPYIAFIGKAANGDPFAKIQKQIRAYFSCDTTFPKVQIGTHIRPYYAIGAQGSKVVFWQYQIKDKGESSCYGLTYEGTGNFRTTIVTDKTLPSVHDLAVETDVSKVVAFLTHFRLEFQ